MSMSVINQISRAQSALSAHGMFIHAMRETSNCVFLTAAIWCQDPE